MTGLGAGSASASGNLIFRLLGAIGQRRRLPDGCRRSGRSEQNCCRDFGKRDQCNHAAFIDMDGKDIRGASNSMKNGRRIMVVVMEHGAGLILGQVEVDSKTHEILS